MAALASNWAKTAITDSSSPNTHSFTGREPQTITWRDLKRFMELRQVAHNVGPQIYRRMRINLQQTTRLLRTRLTPPCLRPPHEESLLASQTVQQSWLRAIQRNQIRQVRNRYSTKIPNILTNRQSSINFLFGKITRPQTLILRNQCRGALIKTLTIFFSPPIL